MNQPTPVHSTLLHQPEPFLDRPADYLEERIKAGPDGISQLESGIEKLLQNTEARIVAVSSRFRNGIKKAPAASVLLAAMGGYLFRRLPVASLLSTGLKVAGALAPPTLIALGIFRVTEYCKHKDREWKSGDPPNDGQPRRVPVSGL